MALISLHDYLQQIDTLLEENRLSEAIAHCRHILQRFPRHVETYRYYGKALLEQQKFDDAVDIFNRVLSADPEDFISHVGLAITHKEKGEVPEALWHFERAFEMDPYNAAIQDELRALYANRDGLRPERINLTRGALARLYFRGNLYRQAADELRHLLSQNGESQAGERLDLQTLLAETLWRDDQRVDVVDVCLRILEKTPFSIKANAILAEVWLVTGRSDEAHEYLQRLRMLTRPEKAHLDLDSVVGRAFTANGIIDLPEKVLIDELDYIPVAQEFSSEADWVAELTIESQEAIEEASWLDEIEKVDADVFAEAAASDEDDMLDWLRDVAASDEDDGITTALGDLEADQAEASVADSPESTLDWFTDDIQTSQESLADVPDWLSEVTASAEADMWNSAIEANESQIEIDDSEADDGSLVEKAETPDWIRDASQENDPTAAWLAEDEAELWAPQSDSSDEFDSDSDFPDWMEDTEDDISDWLEDAGVEVPATDEALPDWLTSSEEESEKDFPEFSTEESIFDTTGEEIPAWLLGSDQRMEIDEALAPDSDHVMDIEPDHATKIFDSEEPDFDALFEVDDETVEDASSGVELEDPFVAAAFGAEDGELPNWLKKAQAESEADPLDDLDELPDWLRADTGFLDKEAEAESERETDAVLETIDENLDWLSDLETAEEPEENDGSLGLVMDDELPDWLNEVGQSEAVEAEQEIVEDMPEWLEDLGAAEQTDTISEELEEAESVDELPDWLNDIGLPEPADEMAEELDEQVSVDELPDWLSDVETAEQTDVESDVVDEPEPDDDTPEWLSEIESLGQADIEADQIGIVVDETLDEQESDDKTAEWLADEYTQTEQTEEDLPDWLEASPELIAGQTDIDQESLPDWLGGSQEDVVREEMLMGNAEEQENKDSDVPDDLDEAMKWLEELAAEQGANLDELPSLHQEQTPEQPSVVEDDDVPDWLKADLSDGGLSSEDDLPDWLKQEAESMGGEDWLGLAGDDELDLTSFDDEAADSTEPAQAGEIPDWLKDQMPEDVQSQINTADNEDLGWLDQIAAGEGAPLEELPTLSWDDDQDDLGLDIDDSDLSWMDDVPELEVDSGEAAVELPDLSSEADEETIMSVPDDPDEAMAWLEQLAAQQGANLDELPTVIDETPSAMPSPSEEVSLTDILDDVDVDLDAPTVFDVPEEDEPEAVSDFEMPDDPDEAMAWLEQLAARQGANLDELPTVSETDFEMESAVVTEMDSDMPTVVDMPTDEVSKEAGFDFPEDPDEAMAWLEQLAARQGANLDELPSVDVIPEQVTPASNLLFDVDDLETLEPEVVSDLDSDAELEMALADLSDIDMPEDDNEALAWLASLTGGTAEAEIEEETAEEEQEDIFEQPVNELELVHTIEVDDLLDSIEPESVDDLFLDFDETAETNSIETDSIFDLIEDETDPLTALPDDLTGEIEGGFADEEIDSALPDWLKFEPVGETSREELDWLDTFGDSDVDSWLEAEELVSQFDMPAITDAPEPEAVAIPEPEPEPLFETGPLGKAETSVIEEFEVEAVPSGPVDEDQLESARTALEIGDMSTALEQYTSMLQAGQGVPRVISDLETAAAKNKKVAPLQRLLGDAYMQNGQLQKAIDTYRQALDNL